MSFRCTGIVSVDDLKKLGLYPPPERLKKGPVVLVECPEEIPCDICVDACPFGVIIKESITSIPKVLWDKCTGCGTCVAKCPGLAIFVVDISHPAKASVVVPYEFLPRPRVGDKVVLLGRDGRRLGYGVVRDIFEDNKTLAVKIDVAREVALEVRGFEVVRHEEEG
ncbi:MAG: ferredoxin [Thermoprotei archaeon]|nr:MAG: ferredoxin [Thermoprotei archaeon]RLF03156.1 MAG: ferredoxin [Thermoprotei archaeon]